MSHNVACPVMLVVFCRRPAVGIGKQRIAATAGPDVALRLSERLLAAALEDAATWPGPVVLAPADAADRAWAGELLGRKPLVVPQGEGNLGARLNGVDRELRAAGHERLVFIGSDAPLLDEAYYTAARAVLEHADVVLGPAEDGGVTLMGARAPWPELGDLPWSTPQLCAALRARCAARGLTVCELEPSYDLDDAAQLPRLDADLAGDPRPARRALRDWLGAQLRLAPLPQESAHAGTEARWSDAGRDPAMPSVAVIIPVLGDTEALERLLHRLRALTPPPAEVIVVDGGTNEDCRRTCANALATWLPSRAGRGQQLREGAARARSAVLWFLHADAEPAVTAIREIAHATVSGASGGYFRFRFSGKPGAARAMLAALINLRARFGVPYGDQGIFATRDAYDAAGGFAEEPLFEEVPLVRALRRTGRFAALAAAIGVSPRRWERDGWIRRTLGNRALAVAYMAGVSPRRLVQIYSHFGPSDGPARDRPEAGNPEQSEYRGGAACCERPAMEGRAEQSSGSSAAARLASKRSRRKGGNL